MNKVKKFAMIFLIGIVCVLVLGMVVMYLWNWLVPTVFNGPQISFWQALGIFLLAKILFGFGGGGKCKSGGGYAWKRRYYEKLAHMSPEERERFKEKMKEKWCSPRTGGGPSAGNSNV